MAEKQSDKRLGRGLAALIGEMDKPVVPRAANEDAPKSVASDRLVPIGQVRSNSNNPRRTFNVAELEELANSIAEHGIVQPILVRPTGKDSYELIAGERRWRAAQQAGLHDVPIVVRDVDDRVALELAIIENVQRADLNPVEEAMGYQQLIDDHAYKQADLGKVIGKSRSHVANMLRLLKLPEAVRKLLANGELSSGHARALITLDNSEVLAKRIVAEGLSVRDTEKLANQISRPTALETKSAKLPASAKDADTKAFEKRLSDHLGLKVSINHKSNGKGQLVIDYKSLDQLDDLAARLGKK